MKFGMGHACVCLSVALDSLDAAEDESAMRQDCLLLIVTYYLISRPNEIFCFSDSNTDFNTGSLVPAAPPLGGISRAIG
jgi:hypothetical protein